MKRNIIFVAAAGLLVLALAVGGAGENFPLLEMILDLAALGAGGLIIWKRSPERLTTLARCALALMAAVILLPLLQLVPLPLSLVPLFILFLLWPRTESLTAADLIRGTDRRA